jgi:hypothetical protein
MAVFSVPGSERISIGDYTKEKINLSKVVLDIESELGIQVVKKIGKNEYEVKIDIKEFGSGKYNNGELFFTAEQAIKKRNEIVTELRKGIAGKYKIVYNGKGEISLYLAD